MTQNRFVQLVAIVCCLGLLAGAWAVSPRIDEHRLKLGLMHKDVEGQLPPGEMLSAATLSIVRGLALDFLWHRCNSLKEQGKFYEANTLAQFITSLQPRFSQVWVFHAWNMAYNISVMTHTPDERWEWVNKGVALLRERAIRFNPESVRIYKELQWMFFHKIGGTSDDANWTYKRRLALEWQEVLGAPIEGANREQTMAAFKPIVDAPDALDQLVASQPGVAAVLHELNELGLKPDETLVSRIGRIMIVAYSRDAQFLDVKLDRLSDPKDRKLAELVSSEKYSPAFTALLAHLRKRMLIDRYNMQPKVMYEVMELFGPLDWRHPCSHSCYWATLGVRVTEMKSKTKDIDLLNTFRGSIHSLQTLMHSGRLSFDPVTQRIDMLPDPRFIPSYETALDSVRDYLKRFGGSEGAEGSFRSGHENFLSTAAMYCYLYGDEAQGEAYLTKVRKLYGDSPDNIRSRRFEKPLAEFVVAEMAMNWDIPYLSRQFVDAMITRALEHGLANDRTDVFEKFIGLARSAWDQFVKAKTSRDYKVAETRMVFDTFDQVLVGSIETYLRQPNLSIISRARIWNSMNEELQRRMYNRLEGPFAQFCKDAGLNPDIVFRAPPGMEEYRKANLEAADAKAANKPETVNVERK